MEGKVDSIHQTPFCDPEDADWHHGIQSFGAIAGIRNNNLCITGSGGMNTRVAGYCSPASNGILLQAMNDGYKIIVITEWFSSLTRATFETLHRNGVTVIVAGLAQWHQAYQDVPGVIHVGRSWLDGSYREYQGVNSNLDVLSQTQGMNRIIEGGTCEPSGEGTSIGAPVVSGVVALMKAANPCLFPEDFEEILVMTADPIPSNADSTITRAGVINGAAAVQMALDFQGIDEVISQNTTIDFENVSGNLDINNSARVTVTGQLNTGKYSQVTVHPGSELRIQGGEMNMGEFSRIIVRRGANLIVDAGTITNRCGDYWRGIVVEGNAGIDQITNPNLAWNDRNGIVIVRNGSEISNARTAISTDPFYIGWPQIQNFWGGYVQVTDSDLLNNNRALAFMRYNRFDRSIIQNTNVIGGHHQCTQWANNGVRYNNCYFAQYSEHAILTIDASGDAHNCRFDGSSIESTQAASIIASYPGFQSHSWEVDECEFFSGRMGIQLIDAENLFSVDMTSNEFQCVDIPISITGLSRYYIFDNDFYNAGRWGNQIVSTGNGIGNISEFNHYLNNPVGIFTHFDNNSYHFMRNGFEQSGSRDFRLNGQGALTGRIDMSQGVAGGPSASNHFSIANSTRSIRLTGPSLEFDYFITPGTPTSSRRFTRYVGQDTSALFDLSFRQGINTYDCIPPMPIIHVKGEDPEERTPREMALYTRSQSESELATKRNVWIQTQTGLSENPNTPHFMSQENRAYNQYRESAFWIIYNESNEGNYQFLKTTFHSDGFDLQKNILDNMVRNRDFSQASDYMSQIWAEGEHQNDYLWTMDVYIKMLRDNYHPSESELSQLENIALKYDPLSGFAHAVYHNATLDYFPFEYEEDEEDIDDTIEGRNSRSSLPTVQVYPNPANDYLDIECNLTIRDVNIYNMNGVLQFNLGTLGIGTHSLDIGSFNSGVYIIRYRNEESEVETRKFVKL